VIAEYISDYLSHKCNILSAPALKYGVGLPRDLYFPGSTTMKFEDLKDTVSSIIEGWQLQGKGLLKSTPHR
jgi:creatinine amidohydrolase/Fe(II)-dependent formamide hydrolase-like protein